MPPRPRAARFRRPPDFPEATATTTAKTSVGIFFQDDWKVRPNLTLSAGLRYSYFGPLTDKDNNMGVLSFGSGTTLLTGITIRTGIDAWTAQKLNFGPQFGFNWSPAPSKSKLVVRGGFGLNYNQEQIANANNYDGNPPGTSSIPGYQHRAPRTSTRISSTRFRAARPTSSAIRRIRTQLPPLTPPACPPQAAQTWAACPATCPPSTRTTTRSTSSTIWVTRWSPISAMRAARPPLLYNYDANALGDIMGAPLNPLVNSVNTFGSSGKSNNNMMLAGLKHQFAHTFSAEGAVYLGPQHGYRFRPLLPRSLSVQPAVLLRTVGL